MNTATQPRIRHKTYAVQIGNVAVGAHHPVVVQSMTNTDTADGEKTALQIVELAKAGSELVRITVNSAEAAQQVPYIRDRVAQLGHSVPIIGDFHFNGHKLLSQYPGCAEALSKYRINPGNVGRGQKRDSQFATMIEIACRYNKPVRIGVNWGSMDQELVVKLMDDNAHSPEPKSTAAITQEALILSALQSAQRAQELGLSPDKIIISCKVSGVQDLIATYRQLASQCQYALHLGLTEAGMGYKGVVASTAALSVLLQEGIGDTIRISLTPEPQQSRTAEVLVAQDILQSLGLRAFTPAVVACPGCGRTSSTFFQEMAQDIQSFLRAKMPQWKETYPGVENMTVAVMGCVVNGPGESKHANIGISLPGTGEIPVAPVYVDGERSVTLKGQHIVQEFQNLVENYVHRTYAK